jgi:MFS family permease
VQAYLAVLRIRDYRLLWTALVLNLLGDGATFTALAWITVERAGAAGLGVLGVCFTLPALVGGAVIGPVLDRFSRRKLLIWDSTVRGFVVAAHPADRGARLARDVAAVRLRDRVRPAEDNPARPRGSWRCSAPSG